MHLRYSLGTSPKRPEGTNSVVAASRTEERSSFYHVSRERERGGEGKRARRGGGERCSKSRRARRRGRAQGGGSNHPYTRRYETTSVPLRRSDFRPIKSPRWRGAEGARGPSPRGLAESPRRALSNFTRNSVNFGAPALCSSRDQPRFIIARARWSRLFFFSPALPGLLFRTERTARLRDRRTSPRAARGSWR